MVIDGWGDSPPRVRGDQHRPAPTLSKCKTTIGGGKMPKNKPLKTSKPVSIEQAWRKGGELEMTHALILKYAKVLDMTDSGRDIKPLATGMLEAVDRFKNLEAQARKINKDTPLMKILGEKHG